MTGFTAETRSREDKRRFVTTSKNIAEFLVIVTRNLVFQAEEYFEVLDSLLELILLCYTQIIRKIGTLTSYFSDDTCRENAKEAHQILDEKSRSLHVK